MASSKASLVRSTGFSKKDKYEFSMRRVNSNIKCFNPSDSGYPEAGSLANTADQDEMPHKIAFYQGLHCLLR